MKTKVLFLVVLFFQFGCNQIFCQEEWEWVKLIKTSHTHIICCTDSLSNVYVTGHYQGSADFGDTIINSNYWQLFVAKFDSEGNRIWLKGIAKAPWEMMEESIIVFGDKLVITGYVEESIQIFDTTFISSGLYSGYVIELDTSGNFEWASHINGSVYGLKILSAGGPELFIYGSYFGEINILDNVIINGGTETKFFLAKINGMEQLQWIISSEGDFRCNLNKLTIDKNGLLYGTGRFDGPFSFDGFSLSNTGGMNVFILKINQNGETLFLKTLPSPWKGRSEAMVTDQACNLYLGGDFYTPSGNRKSFIRLNNDGDYVTGSENWGSYWCHDLAIDDDGYFFAWGEVYGPAEIGEDVFNPNGVNIPGGGSVYEYNICAVKIGNWGNPVQTAYVDDCYPYYEYNENNSLGFAICSHGNDVFGAGIVGNCFVLNETDTCHGPGMIVGKLKLPLINSVNQTQSNNSVNVYPNPCFEIITVDFPNLSNEKKLIQICDVKGMILQSESCAGSSLAVNISNLNPGIYFIIISDERQSYFRKFVKME